MILSGLRFFDIRDVKHPREVAYFNKPVVKQKKLTVFGTGAYAMSQPAWDPAQQLGLVHRHQLRVLRRPAHQRRAEAAAGRLSTPQRRTGFRDGSRSPSHAQVCAEPSSTWRPGPVPRKLATGGAQNL